MSLSALRANSHTGRAWLQARWQALTPRDRLLTVTALVVLLVATLWGVVLRPALSTWRTAAAQRQSLDLQLQRMQQLQAQASAIRRVTSAATQTLPPVNQDTARRALEAAVRQHFGDAARLATDPQGATLSLNGVSGLALAHWLAQARIEARTLPTGARLERQASGTWSGQMTLAWPAAAGAASGAR